MLPVIKLGDLTIPMYGLMFATGFALAVILAVFLAKKAGVSRNDAIYAAVYGAVGLYIGAKLLYFLTRLPYIIEHSEIFDYGFGEFLTVGFGGMVFYGGLIGFGFGVWIYCRRFKTNLFDIADLYAPLVPLAHGFGRIGCFCAGCCYGVENHGFLSVHFPYNEDFPELCEVPRVPVQLMETGLNFICFGVLLWFLIKNIRLAESERRLKQGQLLGIYLAYYSFVRIILEIFRGDKERGSIGFLSTSQFIGILLIPAAVFLILAKKRKPVFWKQTG